MTPNSIEILIHCHTTPAKHPRFDAPAVRETFEFFEQHGLIERNQNERYKDGYKTTDRGAAHIEQLCNLPLPINAWVDKNGELI